MSNDVIKKLKDVWYVPGVTKNLISIAQLVEKQFNVLFTKHGCEINCANDVVSSQSKIGRMFVLDNVKQNCLVTST